jgi:DNA topoisomerase-1
MAKNLVIVESPAKAKTIEGYLGKDFIVKSSFGHVRDLAKKGLAIDIDAKFAPNYEVSADKKQVVSELKKLAKEADTVWLATDEDREGEAISWHLYETLELQKKDTKRITFNEITKVAVTRAIERPREINQELVDAQQARRVLDRIVGFELSPVLWKKVRPSLSAGRVQSVAVRLIVEREREIEKYNTESFYKVQAEFQTTDGLLKAELNQQIPVKAAAQDILEQSKDANFYVEDVQQKPASKSPAAPFTTSTLQQEASMKLGFSVTKTMSVAQRLYESGNITYMRTDSVNLSETAIAAAQEAITSQFGANYSKPTKYSTKTSGAQEAHEAIRPTDFNKPTIQAERDETRLYELIWKRAIASQMALAQLERTTIKIGGLTGPHYFQAKGEVIVFDGFLKVYLATNLDDDAEENTETEGLLPKVTVNEALKLNSALATERFSRAPSRYVEATLVKKLEELGIGRPSTYAPTISTIQKRNYVEKKEREGNIRNYAQLELKAGNISEQTKSETTGKERNKLSPTDIGIVVTDFLVAHFEQILDYQFTAKVEAEFDEIAQGNLNWTDMLQSFYGPFHHHVEETLEHSERATGERELGIDPKTQRKVIARIGRFGPMIQIGDEKADGLKPQFASLQGNQSINNITLEEALKLFDLPRILGEHNGEAVKVNIGRFGPYVQVGKRFTSIPKDEDPLSMDLARAIELDTLKQEEAAKALIKTFDENPDVQLLNGRYGAYLKIGKNNYKLPKDSEPALLTLDECLEIAVNQGTKTAKKRPVRKK